MRDLATTLVIPKLHLEFLEVSHEKGSDPKQFVEPLKAILRSRDTKLSVTDLQILMNLDQEDIYDILSQVKPGILKKVVFIGSENNFTLGKIADLQQWKQVKSLEMRIGSPRHTFPAGFPVTWDEPIDSFLHFRCLRLEYQNELSWEDAKKLVEAAIQQGDEFGLFCISKCECDYHIGGYLEQIASENLPILGDDAAPRRSELPLVFGPYLEGANDDVNRRVQVREAKSCFERRYIATQNREFCLKVMWDKTMFRIEKLDMEID